MATDRFGALVSLRCLGILGGLVPLSIIMPAKYVHVVFTIPHELSWLALQNKKMVCALLFRTSAATLLEKFWALWAES